MIVAARRLTPVGYALIGGVPADVLGNRPALWTAVAGLVGTAGWITSSAVRRARL